MYVWQPKRHDQDYYLIHIEKERGKKEGNSKKRVKKATREICFCAAPSNGCVYMAGKKKRHSKLKKRKKEKMLFLNFVL